MLSRSEQLLLVFESVASLGSGFTWLQLSLCGGLDANWSCTLEFALFFWLYSTL